MKSDGRRGFLAKLLGLVILPRWVSKILPTHREEWVKVNEIWDNKAGRAYRQVGDGPWDEIAYAGKRVVFGGIQPGAYEAGDTFDLTQIRSVTVSDAEAMGWYERRKL